MIKNYKNESGRSMIEMMGVLAVMTIITIAAFTMVPNLMGNQKKLQVREDVSVMVQNVRTLMQGREDFSEIDSRNDDGRIFRAFNMSQKNPYGGNYEIFADPANPMQFMIAVTGLSENDCKYFEMMSWTDSVEYIRSDKKRSGASAEPSNCSDKNGNNKIIITFGQ